VLAHESVVRADRLGERVQDRARSQWVGQRFGLAKLTEHRPQVVLLPGLEVPSRHIGALAD